MSQVSSLESDESL